MLQNENVCALQIAQMDLYKEGQREERLWGFYEVLKYDVRDHQEVCEKILNINPRRALSLQRHKFRSEHWEVLSGTIVVILDGIIRQLTHGDTLFIPMGAVHCIINLSVYNAVLKEKQFGTCREEDNIRFADFFGRPTQKPENPQEAVLKSLKIYDAITRML